MNADKPNNLRDDEIPGLREVLQELRDEAQAHLSPHLSLETLDDYFANRLTSDDKEAIQDHMVACTDCLAQALELTKFCNSEAAELEKPHPDEAAMMWAKVKDFAPVATAPPPAPFTPSLFDRIRVQFLRPGVVYASLLITLATALALAAVIFSLRRENHELIARLDQTESSKGIDPATQNAIAEATRKTEEAQRQRDIERQRAERLESQTAELKAELSKPHDGGVHSGSEPSLTPQINITVEALPNAVRGTSEMELPAGISNFVLLVEDPAPNKSYSKYAIEIRDTTVKGNTLVNQNGLRMREVLGERALTISLPTKSLPAANYLFTIYGVDGEGKRIIEREQLVSIHYK